MSTQQGIGNNQPNAEDNRRNIVERFWQRMQEVVGVIPVRVIAFMDLLQLSASSALAEDRDWGVSVYNDIKEEGMTLFDEAAQRGSMRRSKFEVFGRHEKDMERFRLTGAETSSINAIAKMVRERGIMFFIGEEQQGTRPAPIHLVDGGPAIPLPAELRASLVRRLNDYFNAKPEYFGQNAFNNVLINVEPEQQQQPDLIKVRVKCVCCPNSILCSKIGNTWHISNYIQHVKRKHKPRSDGVYRNTRSHLQVPAEDQASGDDSDSDYALEEETFTSASSNTDDASSSAGSAHEGEEGNSSEVSEDTTEDTEAATAAEQATADPSETAAPPAANGRPRSRVSALVDIFSAGPSTSKSSKN